MQSKPGTEPTSRDGERDEPRLKVLYILPSLTLYGGTPKKTRELIMASQHDSFVYVYDSVDPEFLKDFKAAGATIYFRPERGRVWSHVSALVGIVRRHHVQIVQTQFPMGELLGGVVKLLSPRIKLIIAFVGSASPARWKRGILRLIYSMADGVVFVSRYVRAEKLEQFPLLAFRRSRVIPNGTQRYHRTGSVTQSLGGDRLLCVSGLTQQKNIGVLIEAMDILVNQRRRRGVHLYIAGEGPLRGALEQLISGRHLQDNVQLLGYRRDVLELLTQCDVFLHPSIGEGFGIAVIEAMMAGRPVVVSRAGALPEIVANGKSGLLVEATDPRAWAEALSCLLTDRTFAAALAAEGAKTAAAKYSIERSAASYDAFYREVVDSDRSVPGR